MKSTQLRPNLRTLKADIVGDAGSTLWVVMGAGATTAICGLIEAILLEPDGNQLKITLKGDLAGMLSAATDSKRSPDTGDLLVQIQMVAGASNHLDLEFAWAAA